MASSKALKNLQRLGTCAISEALVALRHPRGGLLDGIRLRSSPSSLLPAACVCGPVVTVALARTGRHDGEAARGLEWAVAGCAEPGAVVYVHQPPDAPGAPPSTCWGRGASIRASYRSAKAVVVNGRVHKVDIECVKLKFAAFSLDTSTVGLETSMRISSVNTPLQFKDDLWINPGDIMVGDEDGVVVTPPSLVKEVVALCRKRPELAQKLRVPFAGETEKATPTSCRVLAVRTMDDYPGAASALPGNAVEELESS